MALHRASLKETKGPLRDSAPLFASETPLHERRGDGERAPEAGVTSLGGVAVLAVVLGRLHLEDVRNDAVDGDVTNQAGEEELLRDGRVHEAQGGETSQDAGQPGDTRGANSAFCLYLGMTLDTNGRVGLEV